MNSKNAHESPEVAPTAYAPYRGTHLQPDFTFDTLVAGRSNRLALAAANTFVRRSESHRHCSPLLIFGGIGVGKTHLLHAIGNAIFFGNPQSKICYIHAEEYFSNVVRAYKTRSFDEFKSYYQSLDVLIFDDIQMLTSRPRSQEELFCAINALTAAGKKIVISCDICPSDLIGIDKRLLSHCDGGLTVAIGSATSKMRKAIVVKLASSRGLMLSDEVAVFVSKRLRSDVRKLRGAVNRFVLNQEVQGRQMTRLAAKRLLNEIQ